MRAGLVRTALEALVGLAELAAHKSELERPVEILSLVLAHPATGRRVKDGAQDLLAELASQLPPKVLARAKVRGEARELDDLAAEVLGGSVDVGQTGGK